MGNATAQGFFNVTTGQNTSGSPVAINALGQIIYANFFNTGAIGNPEPDRTYSIGVQCLESADPNCPRFVFFDDVGNTNVSNFAVRGYNEIVLAGSKWGIPQETIQSSFGASLASNTGTEYVDASYATANTGYPVLGSQIPQTELCFNGTETNHVGSERDVMAESWWYDICQDTGQGSDVVGTLNNNYGTQSQTNQHNNQILEVMVHVGPVSMNQAGAVDSAMGQRNPAQFFCSGPITIGNYDYEIWYGRNGQQNVALAQALPNGQSNPNGALVVYNRLGRAGGPYGTNITAEANIRIDWSGILNHSRNNLQGALTACNAWGNGSANTAWTNPSHPDNPFTRMQSACGAVGGIEFGVEPQLNNATDQEYRLTLDKLQVTVEGEIIGPCLTEFIDVDVECKNTVGEIIVFSDDCEEVPFSFTCGDCSCKKIIMSRIEGPEPKCAKIGDCIIYSLVSGCNCDGECGGLDFEYKTFAHKPKVTITENDPMYSGATTMKIGPLTSCDTWDVGLKCKSLPVC